MGASPGSITIIISTGCMPLFIYCTIFCAPMEFQAHSECSPACCVLPYECVHYKKYSSVRSCHLPLNALKPNGTRNKQPKEIKERKGYGELEAAVAHNIDPNTCVSTKRVSLATLCNFKATQPRPGLLGQLITQLRFICLCSEEKPG